MLKQGNGFVHELFIFSQMASRGFGETHPWFVSYVRKMEPREVISPHRNILDAEE